MATNLPELRQYMAQYLDFDTLKAFSVVCKAWYLDARPILWSCFKCRPEVDSPEEYALWLETIRKNAISFRHIWYYDDMAFCVPGIREILLSQCHSLVSIRMDISARHFQDPVCGWEATLRPLIEQNRIILRQLELYLGRDLPITFLPSLLINLPHLRSLVLGTYTIMVKDLFSILDGCPSSLERLALRTSLTRNNLNKGDSVKDPDYSIPSIATPLRLKYLHIPCSYIQGAVEDILSRVAAHSLQDFEIKTSYCLRITPTVRDALWRLTSLTLKESIFHVVDERALPGFLEAIHPHQLRRVSVDMMTRECIAKLIEKQHQSLESLSVHFDNGHTGALADILATCGRLKRLTFSGWPSFVNIQTLIDPQKPWVCTELEVFEGDFGLALPEEPRDLLGRLGFNKSVDVKTFRRIEDQFMHRLGQLTNLRCLVQNISASPAVYDQLKDEGMKQQTVEWSLASGLEHLHGLVHIRTFKINDHYPRKWIGIPEMMFIKQHWQSLREMVCKDVGDMDVQEWLATEWPEMKATTPE
ncbi:MAG: hypothetical protein J3Q66DRAFT_406813 [Benniella sp.]|nr:MAG: hypothetical protein J3Q66DRAFT_406813 [Benniella sp.]